MYKKFDKIVEKLLNSITFTILLFIVGFTVSGLLLYNSLDFKFATEKDYEPLYQTQQTIIDNFDSVYTFSNTNIDITDSNIIISIYGDDCTLKTYFDKAKLYQNTEQIDGTPSIWISLSLLILGCLASSALFYILVIITIVLIDMLLGILTKSIKPY